LLKKKLKMKPVYLLSFILLFASCDYIKSSEETTTEKSKKKKEKVSDGVKKNYHKGKLASTVTYKDGLKNGSATNYYPDGKVNMEFNYKNGVKDGPYKWFFENGKVYIEGQYKENEKHGIFKTYRDNGSLLAEMPWHEGMACTGLKEYFESGNRKPVPKLVVKHKNTVRLNGQYKLEISLSDKSAGKFYEGYLNDNNSFPDYFSDLNTSKSKGELVYFLNRGDFMMKKITIIAKIKTREKNFYILTKKINLSVENRF